MNSWRKSHEHYVLARFFIRNNDDVVRSLSLSPANMGVFALQRSLGHVQNRDRLTCAYLNEFGRVDGKAGLGARDGEGQNESRANECGEHDISRDFGKGWEALKLR